MLYRIKQLIVVLGDLFLLYFSLFLALFIRYFQSPWQKFVDLFTGLFPLFIVSTVIFYIAGLYDISKKHKFSDLLQKTLFSNFAWIFFGFAYFYFQQNPVSNPKTILLITALIFSLFSALWRYGHFKFLAKNILKTKVIIIGITKESLELANLFIHEPERGYALYGFVDSDTNKKIPEELLTYPLFNSFEKLKENNLNCNLIILSPEIASNENLAKEIYAEFFTGVSIVSLVDIYEKNFGCLPPIVFSQTWFLNNLPEQEKKIYDRIKIILDYFSALLMGIFFIITFPVIALLIKLTSSGPIFFVQTRVGLFGKTFKMYKYRTMQTLNKDGSAETNGPQYAQKHDFRITPIGKFLRATRLDEIPQFINIFRNEMSLIGPRPERPEFVEELTQALPYYRLRHLTKPGLTGWAQLHNSYYGSIEENLKKLEYDLYYIQKRSPMLDLMIILKTVAVVLKMMGR